MKLWHGEPDHNHWRRRFTAGERAVFWWGLAACFILLGVSEWFTPSRPPFTGKWAWLSAWAYGSFGPNGLVALQWGIAAALLCVGTLIWVGRDS